ncbi:hypothetical protein C3492_36990 [Streptomyces sp. Ru62]|uniref:hypothetical protein n=1 Tax=Streptomyces sp. Ru62 TaxID=2080745 RepID=UPI000CDD53BA|nr:hypothetical protein [Streptomyces sp. Ru62]POX58635.1 hypothetical protein C3492_36990 [Streptomyces sp. Ru62]
MGVGARAGDERAASVPTVLVAVVTIRAVIRRGWVAEAGKSGRRSHCLVEEARIKWGSAE